MIDVMYQGLIEGQKYILEISICITFLSFLFYLIFRPRDILYRHYKGGIYKFIRRGVKHTEIKGQVGVFYQHIRPHKPDFYYRPEEIFFGTLEDGTKRFTQIN